MAYYTREIKLTHTIKSLYRGTRCLSKVNVAILISGMYILAVVILGGEMYIFKMKDLQENRCVKGFTKQVQNIGSV